MAAAAALRVGTAEEMADAVTRSHLADGRCVGWYGDPAAVVDAEIADQPIPPLLAENFGTEDFWARWTAAECAAKLADVSILVWLREHGLSHPGAEVATLHLWGLVVSVGRPAGAGRL